MITRRLKRSTHRLLAAFLSATLLGVAAVTPALATAPSNDDIGSPIVIGAIPYSNTQDTSEATTGGTDPDCGFGTGPTVWYSYTASATEDLLATTFGSDYDTTLTVGLPDGAGGVDVIGCNDDAGSLQSAVSFLAEAGQTYLFMIGAFAGGPGGTLVFDLDVGPPPVTVDVTLAPTGSFTSDGSAIIRGTVTCSGEASFVDLFVGVTQRVGRFTIRGFGGGFVDGCSTTPTPWEAAVVGETGKFAGGQVSVFAEAFACGPINCAFDFAEGKVRLRR